MKKGLLIGFICLALLALITSCVPSKYVHNDPAFSYEYPSGYEKTKLEGKNEVSRFGNPANAYKLPVYVASVVEKPKGLKLEAAPDQIVKGMKETYPQSLRFKILETKKVKLSDGSDAMTMTLKWKLNPTAPVFLQTASVMSFKGDKLISISGSTIFGYTPLEEMMGHCLTLNLQ